VSPRRLSAIEDQLLASGLEFALRRYGAPLATCEQLCRAHAAPYVEQIFSAAPTEGIVWLDQSTSMVPHILKAALRAAGAVVFGVDLAMYGQTRAAYRNVRPPGHHAEHDHAMGYCIFNNVAVGAAHTLHAHALERVAIVDFDAHHGNGTADSSMLSP
jgi:acetoin utilization deacetylase AcuC-like enzyme